MNSRQRSSVPSMTSLAQLERLLQIMVATLVVLGTTLLAMGQQNVVYALVAVVAAAGSVIICDIKRYFCLGPDSTTLAALVACVVLVAQVIRNAEESHLLNVANILIYLEIILLFQRKDDRTYWSLMALSLLQVVVAAALNLGLAFGLLLSIYVLFAFTALMLFYVLRETRQYVPASAAPGMMRDPAADAKNVELLYVGQLSEQGPRDVLSRSFFLRLMRMIAFTACGTVVVFFAIPRFTSSAWQSSTRDQVATVGFTEEVRLDDISRILESPEQVMRVEFMDFAGNPYQVDGEPYFRGTVLSNYRRGDGVWKQSRADQGGRLLRELDSFDLASTILQRITLQPGSHSALFHVSPCHYVDGSPTNLELNESTGQVTVSDDETKRRGTYRYTLGTTAFRNGWQRDIIPATRVFLWDASFEEADTDELRNELRDELPGLTQVADQVIATARLPVEATFERAKALEEHFRRSGVYSYSLEASQQRDRSRDPIEDFVTNHRSGHCEYFAGALTLMLRSQGIPARMVVGYKGGEFNTVGNYYIVRQLHAHAWVEAYLKRDEIPEEERDGLDSTAGGAWLTLDPTFGTDDVNLNNQRMAFVTVAREFADYCQVLWDDYVLGLNSARQQQVIYGPIRRNLIALGRALFSGEVWRARWDWLVATYRDSMARRILGVPVFVVAVAGLAAVGAALYQHRLRIRRRSAVWLRKLRPARSAASSAVTQRLDIYEQLQQILATIGLHRQPTQTPYEFALLAERQLSANPATVAWGRLPQGVTEAYCRVRYGLQELPLHDHQRLRQEVHSLQAAVALLESTSGGPKEKRSSR